MVAAFDRDVIRRDVIQAYRKSRGVVGPRTCRAAPGAHARVTGSTLSRTTICMYVCMYVCSEPINIGMTVKARSKSPISNDVNRQYCNNNLWIINFY